MKKTARTLLCSILLIIALSPAGKIKSQSAFLVKDIYPGSAASAITNPTDVNGTLFFIATDGTHGIELWKSDGTAGGTVLVKVLKADAGGSYNGVLINVNGILLFNGVDNKLWKSDGTDAGTVMLKDLTLDLLALSDGKFVNTTFFFVADDGIHGSELWKTDGTANQTVLVKDINLGIESAFPSDFCNVNGTLFFNANDGGHGYELWTTDGTEAGTKMVADINPDAPSSYPKGINFNGIYLFTADDGQIGRELWKSDGTTSGTVLVKDIVTGSEGSDPDNFFKIGSIAYFSLLVGTGQTSYLWRTDGTQAGTFALTNAPFARASMTSFTDYNGSLIFRSLDTHEIWKSDGTNAGTVMVKNIGYDGSPEDFVNVNGLLYFRGDDGAHGLELMKSDGTTAGTTLVKDIQPGTIGSYPDGIINANGTLFFAADNGVVGTELWSSDKTDAGTTMVTDINPGANHSFPRQFIIANRTLFFTADDGTHGRELWAVKFEVGIDKKQEISLQIYPNPATERIIIRHEDINFDLVEIMNIEGKVLISVPCDGTSSTINIKSLQPGIYFARVKNENGSFIKKFIKE